MKDTTTEGVKLIAREIAELLYGDANRASDIEKRIMVKSFKEQYANLDISLEDVDNAWKEFSTKRKGGDLPETRQFYCCKWYAFSELYAERTDDVQKLMDLYFVSSNEPEMSELILTYIGKAIKTKEQGKAVYWFLWKVCPNGGRPLAFNAILDSIYKIWPKE